MTVVYKVCACGEGRVTVMYKVCACGEGDCGVQSVCMWGGEG